MTAEHVRLLESQNRSKHWKRWGPYVSERAWGTVREDYSATGEAWDYFPHDHARSRAYRWNEDGLAGICDRHQVLCFALALWNERDPILKERLFGLSGGEGNHGEDVKEYYFYLDSTPTHSYMKYLYKYPQAEYPYARLRDENKRRGKDQPEFELLDTGVFDENRYFDVFVEYAKADYEDICIKITVANRGPEAARLRLLPTLWFRNTWLWNNSERPSITAAGNADALIATANEIGEYQLYFERGAEVLFTENDTNFERIFGGVNPESYVKDAFHNYVVQGRPDAVNPARYGTKAALHYTLDVDAGSEVTVRLRLVKQSKVVDASQMLGSHHDAVFNTRKNEADEFYATVIPQNADADTANITRQAFAGLLWSKQFYHYIVRDWLNGDPAFPPPPPERKNGRNKAWRHLYNADIMSMPDKWEYPWYAAWDLAFHCVAMALVDPEFAKEQLVLMLREWYMHPNGQIPAYEWAFGDVNPPVHAWAAYQVFLIDRKLNGGDGDRDFLARVFQKLLLNFTWWVNRKDLDGQNVFQGGFLGLDNIGVFDRSAPLPTGGTIEQSDGTSWMATYCLDMLAIALELAAKDDVYEDVASKFWEHFIYIAHAMNHMGDDGLSLWDEGDGFFYDVLHLSTGERIPMRVRSIVGLIPLFAVQTITSPLLGRMKAFKRRMDWFMDNRPDLTDNMACMADEGVESRRLFSIVDRGELERILKVMLDESEFLSPYGIRALSRYHKDHPYSLEVQGMSHSVMYEPGESSTGLFGGNSNWRGPIWMPANYLLIQALCRLHQFYGESFKVECPTGSGNKLSLHEVGHYLAQRLVNVFRQDEHGHRPVYGSWQKFQDDPHWRDLIQFHEYFNGDTGAGLGASHQTGWTALVASLIHHLSTAEREERSTVAAANLVN
jgi:Glycosyl hydrolase family 63 C-terminal domain